jgi:hypothetical protein
VHHMHYRAAAGAARGGRGVAAAGRGRVVRLTGSDRMPRTQSRLPSPTNGICYRHSTPITFYRSFLPPMFTNKHSFIHSLID